jgi:hypothetical protein
VTEPTHIIEIEEIVLIGTTPDRTDRLPSLIELEVQRVLTRAGIPLGVAGPNSETSVAAEVARCVARAVRGRER